MSIQPAAKVEHEITPNKNPQTIGLQPNPTDLIRTAGRLDPEVLKPFVGKSILSAEMFNRDRMLEICKLAAYLQTNIDVEEALTDKIMLAAFFEPSTRTRLSFENAILRLGGKTLSITDGMTTSIAKGESLVDIGQMFNSYADVVVVRHTEPQVIQELTQYLNVPVINAGNGMDEHPTQALADWFALLKWRPEIGFADLPEDQRLHVGIIGTPCNMRTVKSFLMLMASFKKNIRQVTIVSDLADPVSDEVRELLDIDPVPLVFTNELDGVLEDMDVVYINSIVNTGQGYVSGSAGYSLNRGSKLKKDAVILHPLSREDEISQDLDDTDHNLYFNQADGAVAMRKALLLCIFDRLNELPDRIIMQ